MRYISICLLYLFIAGCTAHKLSIEENASESAIYEMSERDAFNIAYSAIQEVFPQEEISVLTHPSRGYVTKFLAPPFYVDWFYQKVFIHRATGSDSNNNNVNGYWIEVSGSGSSFLQGQLKNSEVFDKIIGYYESEGKKHVVSNIKKAQYTIPKEEFYVKGADYLEGKGTRIVISNDQSQSSTDDADRIRKLHQLKMDGIITEEEFQAKKKEILGLQ